MQSIQKRLGTIVWDGRSWSMSLSASITMQAELDLDFSTVLVSDSEADIEGFICGWHVCEELQVRTVGRHD